MREIKFRSYDEKYSHFEYFDLGRGFEDHDYYCLVNAGSDVYQYTGFKDKNGVEIYEGDIVKYTDRLSDFDGMQTTGQVNWYPSKCALVLQDIEVNKRGGNYICLWEMAENIEVTGNIHENPELLSQGKES